MRRLAAAATLLLAGLAHAADPVDNLGLKLSGLEAEATDLEHSLMAPPVALDQDAAEKRLIQAQVDLGVGHVDDAAILLYDLVEKYPNSRAYPDGLFYLGEALFQRGDNYTSRDTFEKYVDLSTQGAHYTEALERLVELSIRLKDDQRIEDTLARLDQLPPAKRPDSVAYIRGKYSYFHGDLDMAVTQFTAIPKESKYWYQARYFAATTYVAQKDLDAAAAQLEDLIKFPGRTEDEKKVLELAHLALGRIHYEKDEPGDAIDQYNAISRHSTVFDEALYEVAWVYVKDKQFDKALRALELLSLANPKSAMMPDVRILEGNLRIRKASTSEGNSAEEFTKATLVFDSTADTFKKPKQEIDAALASHSDPKSFFAQIAGRAATLLEIRVQLGEVASAYVMQEANVGRMVGIAHVLDEIKQDLDDSERLLTRIDHAVNSPTRVMIFPQLFDKRSHSLAIEDSVFGIRQLLVTQERAIADHYLDDATRAELNAITTRRKDLAAELARIPGATASFEERVGMARRGYLDLDKRAQEVDVAIYSIEAELTALEKYYHDVKERKMPAAEFEAQIKELRGAANDLRAELVKIRSEGELDADQAGIGDEGARAENDLRGRLTAAVRAEHAYMQNVASRASVGGDDAERWMLVGKLMRRCDGIDEVVARANKKIDKEVDESLTEVKQTIADEKSFIAQYQQTRVAYDGEGMDLGGEVVASSFDSVAKKFYEIGVRADVGLLDVTWGESEQAGQGVERLRLDYAHQKTLLDTDFRDVRDENKADEKPAVPVFGGEPGAHEEPNAKP
jgi:TolA-binding protein